MPVTDPNRSLLETLKNHVSSDTPRDYALLLNGGWGTGKTYLINRFIEGLSTYDKNRPLLISLYGIENLEQIDSEIFAKLYPVFNKKGARLAGIVGKALLKNIRIDLDDLKKGFTAGGGGIEIGATDIFNSNPKGRIIIFDDLERCSISPDILLGYIHQLIDDGKNRVILLANEREITSRDEDRRSIYEEYKEKTIGFTLKINSDFNGSYSSFVQEVTDCNYKKFLIHIKNNFISNFVHNFEINLRILRRIIVSFELLYSRIDNKYKLESHYDAIGNIFFEVYIAFLITRQDNFSINCLNLEKINTLMRDKPDEKNSKELKKQHDEILKKYGRRWIRNYSLPFSLKEDLVCHNHIDTDKLNTAISENQDFHPPATWPAWQKLYQYWNLSPSEFDQVMREFKSDFQERKYLHVEDILQAFSIYLEMKDKSNKKNDFPLNKNLDEFTRYIDDAIKKSPELIDDPIYPDDTYLNPIQNGWGFRSETQGSFQEEFSQAKKILYRKIREQRALKEAKDSSDFFEKTKNNPKLFRRLLISDVAHNAPYARIPILASIDPEVFSAHLAQQHPVIRKEFLNVLNLRHDKRYNPTDAGVDIEKEWLMEIKKLTIYFLRSENIDNILLDSYINTIDHYIDPCFLKIR